MADGALQRPLAVQVRPVLLRVLGALDGLAGGLRVEVALVGAVHLVAHVAAVVLAVALERLRGGENTPLSHTLNNKGIEGPGRARVKK